MEILRHRGRSHRGRDPEKGLRQLNRRFREISRRYERAMVLRRLYRWAKMLALAAIGVALLYWGFTSLTPWPLTAALKHLAAFPSCEAARAVGVAPASKGEPGYWQRHDADGDGTACELF